MNWAYVMIGLGAAAAVATPLLFIPALNTITTFPAGDPCTSFSCAEMMIKNCQPGSFWIEYGSGPLSDSLRANVTGWQEGRCGVEMQIVYGELALTPPPYHVCLLERNELANWNAWRNSAHEGIGQVEESCEIREV